MAKRLKQQNRKGSTHTKYLSLPDFQMSLKWPRSVHNIICINVRFIDFGSFICPMSAYGCQRLWIEVAFHIQFFVVFRLCCGFFWFAVSFLWIWLIFVSIAFAFDKFCNATANRDTKCCSLCRGATCRSHSRSRRLAELSFGFADSLVSFLANSN